MVIQVWQIVKLVQVAQVGGQFWHILVDESANILLGQAAEQLEDWLLPKVPAGHPVA